MAMPDVTRGSAVSAVFTALRDQILSGELLPGQALAEPDIAAQLQVSRTPVREALNHLEAQGLIVRRHRRPVVAELNPETYAQICEVRIPLERVAIERLAVVRSPEVLAALERNLAHTRYEVEQENWPAASRLSRDFHSLIHESSGNPVLARVLYDLHTRLEHFGQYKVLHDPDIRERLVGTLASHESVVEAVRDGLVEVAVHRLGEHLHASLRGM